MSLAILLQLQDFLSFADRICFYRSLEMQITILAAAKKHSWKYFISAMASRLSWQHWGNLMGLQGKMEREHRCLPLEITAIILKMLLSCDNSHQRGSHFPPSSRILQTWITPLSRHTEQRGSLVGGSPNGLVTNEGEFDGRLVSRIKKEVICSTANSLLINFSNWGSSTHYLFRLLRWMS